MKELELFLKALSEELGNKRGLYIPLYQIKPSKFGAVTTYTMEVWIVDDTNKHSISSISRTETPLSEEDARKIKEELTVETIKNVLKWYGI